MIVANAVGTFGRRRSCVYPLAAVLCLVAVGGPSVFNRSHAQTGRLVLISQESSTRAIAIDSVTFKREPFDPTSQLSWSSDNRTRVMLFATNLTLAPGENASSVTARAEDASLNFYPMTVEYVGAVPALGFLTEVVVVLPSNLPAGQSVLVNLTWHGQTTNKARIRIK